MKTYAEFLTETAHTKNKESMTIEKLSDIRKKIIKDISKKIGITLGLMQQTVVMMQEPYPHIHCKYQEIVDGLPEQNTFLADECCQTLAKLATEYGLEVHIVKPDEDHGAPGDIIARANIAECIY